MRSPRLRLVEAVRRRNGYAMPRLGSTVQRALLYRLPPVVDVDIVPGVRVPIHLDQTVERGSWWLGARYEAPTVPLLEQRELGATAFFDVGANYGFFSYRALAAGVPRVVAFEPNPGLVARMEQVVARNGLDRMEIVAAGLSDERTSLTLNIRDEELGHSTFGARDWAGASHVDVPVLPFDEWVGAHPVLGSDAGPWVAKIDVEGFELAVLRGMEGALRRHAFSFLVVELNRLVLLASGTSREEVVSFLASFGYRPVGVLEEGDVVNGFFAPSTT